MGGGPLAVRGARPRPRRQFLVPCLRPFVVEPDFWGFASPGSEPVSVMVRFGRLGKERSPSPVYGAGLLNRLG
jgi:hypothetical protein